MGCYPEPPLSFFARKIPEFEMKCWVTRMSFQLTAKLLDFLPHFLLGFSKTRLHTAKKFIFFAINEGQIIIGQLTIFLFQFPFDDIPVTFDFEFIHNVIWVGSPLDRLPAALWMCLTCQAV